MLSSHQPRELSILQHITLDFDHLPTLLAILTRVSIVQRKPDTWIGLMRTKFTTVGITTTQHLVNNFARLNPIFHLYNLPLIHNTTFDGL